MRKPQWPKTVYEIVFGNSKIVADVNPEPDPKDYTALAKTVIKKT
jgi:hypothetical protein